MPDTVGAFESCPAARACPECQQPAGFSGRVLSEDWFKCEGCQVEFAASYKPKTNSDKRQELLNRFMHWFHQGFTITELQSVLDACDWTAKFTGMDYPNPLEYDRADTWADCESRTALLATMIERLEESKK